MRVLFSRCVDCTTIIFGSAKYGMEPKRTVTEMQIHQGTTRCKNEDKSISVPNGAGMKTNPTVYHAVQESGQISVNYDQI